MDFIDKSEFAIQNLKSIESKFWQQKKKVWGAQDM